MVGPDDDDPREVELSSLSAIYPELQLARDDDANQYTITLDVPVCPTEAITVFFPATAGVATDAPGPADLNAASRPRGGGNIDANKFADAGQIAAAAAAAAAAVDSHELAYLPPVRIEMVLGPVYPADQPPQFRVSTTPPWLPEATARRLEDDGPRLWEEMGRDTVTFTYIDHVAVAAEAVFGLVDDRGGLEVDAEHKIAILDYDIQARRAAFERETFSCGVCLDPKKGSVCHRMLDCGHVFCRECLRDFYHSAIKEGSVGLVRCLDPGCAKAREKAAESTPAPTTRKKRKKRRAFLLSPSELLQIPLEHDAVKRYVTLKYKTELESDKNTIYCPRPWCNGAARSKKHRKPDGLESAETDSSPDEDDDDNPGGAEGAEGAEGGAENTGTETQATASGPMKDRLAICEDCSFAFCRTCKQSWHGEFIRCRPSNGELSEDDKASLAYMRHYTTPCPTCATPAQKTHGCNHMICSRCDTHFCYLCATWLDPGNPYQHFNATADGRKNSCFMRLWELEEGDGLEGGHVLPPRDGPVAAPPRGAQRPAAPAAPAAGVPAGNGPPQQHGAAAREPGQNGEAGARPVPVAVAREGPLVLRIEGAPAVVPPAVPAAPARMAAEAHHVHDGVGQARGGGGRGRGGGGGARRPGDPIGPAGGAGRRRPRTNAGRGAGGGAGGGAGAGAGAGAARHNPNAGGGRGAHANANAGAGDGPVLDAAHEAWIRHFVQLALHDHEELLLVGEDIQD